MADTHERSISSLTALQRLTDPAAIEAAVNEQTWYQEQTKWTRFLQWFENTTMLMGNHLGRWFFSGEFGVGVSVSSLSRNSFDALVAKTADNHLIRPFENVIGMMTESEIEPRVARNDDSPASEDGAAISEIALQLHFEKPMRLHAKAQEAVAGSLIWGTTIAETEYGSTNIPVEVPVFKDRKVPNELYDPDSPEDPDVNPKTVIQTVESGTTTELRRDMNLRIWTPFHITPDPAATSEDDLTWISRHTFVDRTYVSQNFVGSEADGFLFNDEQKLLGAMVNEHSSKWGLYWWMKIQDIIESPQHFQQGGGLANQSSLANNTLNPDQILFRVVDVRPSHEFPRGRTLVVAGNRLVWQGDARAWSEKYPDRWHPYAFHHWLKIPGRFWGVAMLSQLVPLQKKINAIDALVHKNRQFMSIGQYYIPNHSRVKDGGVGGIPGLHIKYTAVPGMEGPRRVENQPLPPALWEEKAQLINSINQISASSVLGDQVSKSAARSGSMLEFFQRERMRSKTQMAQSYERFLETIGQNTLLDLQLNLTEDDPELTGRMRAAAAEFSALSIRSFTGASLRDHHTVKIDVASKLRHSPEARAERAMQFLNARGQVAAPEEVDLALSAAGLNDFKAGPANVSLKKANRMVARLFDGSDEGVIVMPGFDQPAVMAPVFAAAVLSDKFFDLSDELKKVMVGLAQQYGQMAAEERQAAIQEHIQMAQAGRGPAGPPQQ